MNMEFKPSKTRFLTLVIIAFLILIAGLGYIGNKLQNIEAYMQSLLPASDIAAFKQTVYVPAYSHIYSKGGIPYLLEVTLSVRNTDPNASLTLTRADYFDTNGKLLRRYVADPLQITQLQSKSFIVEHKDFEGGSGANFIVEWKSDKPVSNPIIEAIMIGIDPEYQVSFLANGVPLQHTK